MAKCKQCGAEYEAKSRSLYCSPACKQTFYRNRLANVTAKSVTIEPEPVTIPKGVTSEQHPVPDKYQMTVMERLFYRPGQRDFVSLPGRACYGAI